MSLRDLASRVGSLLVLASLAATGWAASTAAPTRPSGPGTAPAPRRGVRLPTGRPMPDSVLAVVAKGRTITVSAFHKGRAQVEGRARPDSLTPQGARQFLDLLIDKEVLAEHASQETWEWTAIESAQVANLRDRTMMRIALDRSMAEHRRARAARGDSALRPEALGVAARESTVARLGVTYDEVLLARLAAAWAALPRPSADSTIWARLRVMGKVPVIDPADSARVVARSSVGSLRVTDLLDAWKKLNPLMRPRVESSEQVRDLVENGLYERVLRREAEQERLDRHPTVADVVRRQREFLASQYFVIREVYGKVRTDDATLRRYYDRDPDAWGVPTRLSVVRMVLPERGEAAQMAVRLRDPAEADTLVARGLRQQVNYAAEIAAHSDSALFAAALASGTGTVLGPDSVEAGWQVVRVNAVLPAHGRPFEEVKDLVKRAWNDEESERLMRLVLASLRKRTRVVINERALVAAAKPLPPIR